MPAADQWSSRCSYLLVGIITMSSDKSTSEAKPLCFNEIKDAIENGDLHLLKRSDDDQVIYRARMAKLKAEWKSAGDFIIHDKFGIPYHIDEPTNMKFVPRPLECVHTKINDLALLENDFPYHFEKDVKHLLLWKLGKDAVVTEQDVANSLKDISTKYKVVNSCFFINPPEPTGC